MRKSKTWKTKKEVGCLKRPETGPERWSWPFRWSTVHFLIRNGLIGRMAVKKPLLRKGNGVLHPGWGTLNENCAAFVCMYLQAKNGPSVGFWSYQSDHLRSTRSSQHLSDHQVLIDSSQASVYLCVVTITSPRPRWMISQGGFKNNNSGSHVKSAAAGIGPLTHKLCCSINSFFTSSKTLKIVCFLQLLLCNDQQNVSFVTVSFFFYLG